MATGPGTELDPLFKPRSIAVLGASADESRIGGRPLRYLLEAGYRGRIYPVNPRHKIIQGLPAYAHVSEIGQPVDLAIVALASPLVVDAVRDCAEYGVRACVIFSAGFAEVDSEGAQRQEEITRIARETGLRVLGPNCLGVMNVNEGVMATFSASIESGRAIHGRIGFVSQSGAFGSHCFAAARQRNLGFSCWVTTGNESDVDFADCLAYLAQDGGTDVIVAYMEGCRDGAKLAAALDLADRNGKPVVLMKVGSSAAGAVAAASHTASLVGSDSAFDAVFRRFNVHRAQTIAELLDVTEACVGGVFPSNDRVGLLTVSGGVGILMADAAEQAGLDVTPLPDQAQKHLLGLWPYAGVNNPVDTTAQTINQPELLGQFVETMLEEGGYGSVVAFLTHVGLAPAVIERFRGPLVEAKRRFNDRLIIVSMLCTPDVRQQFRDDGFVVVEDPSAAVQVAAALTKLRLGSEASRARRPSPTIHEQIPPLPPAKTAVSEHTAKQLLAKAGIPTLQEHVVHSRKAALEAANLVGRPVVLKVASAKAQHKSDVGGVLVNLRTDDQIQDGFDRLTEVAAQFWPGAELDGVLVAPFIAGGIETIIGFHRDATFGPIVMFGFGGVQVEVWNDVTFSLPPLTREDALEMITHVRGRPLLTGLRGADPSDVDALADAISVLSRVALTWDDVQSVEINPLLVLPKGQGVVALDALVITGESARQGKGSSDE